MPLPAPILDDRSYEQLRDELIRRIPVYTPEWTDHNVSDPGITLIELFSFLGENLLYRFNQIPETTKLEFLRLLQIPVRPAAPAQAMVSMATKELDGVLVPLKSEAKAGSVVFGTQTEVRVLPISVMGICKARTEPPSQDAELDLYGFYERTIDAIGGVKSGETPAAYQNEMVPLEGDGQPVDFDNAVDGMLWVAVLAEVDESPSALITRFAEHEGAPLLLNIGFVPDLEAPDAAAILPCTGEQGDTPPPRVDWEISTGRFDQDRSPVYKTIRPRRDTSRGLTQEGVLRLELPRSVADMGVFALDVPEDDPDRAGTRGLPPVLDEETEKRILFWLRAFSSKGDRFGKVVHLAANAAEVLQQQEARIEFLGTGTAQPGQTYNLVHKPVIAGSLLLEVEGPDGWEAWEEVDGFHVSGESDHHYTLDSEAGRVRFGSGLQGLAPQIGRRIRATKYVYGGGVPGNVAPKAISKLSGASGVEVVNYLWGHGGADAETIAEALDRIPSELTHRDRTVTSEDFRRLALMTPGADLGRAECLARFHPHTRNRSAAGVVTVVVWPKKDAMHPETPLPDRQVLRAVCRFLDARRLVTTELYVIPPTYRKVAVTVSLKVAPGYGIDAVRLWVELVIRQYLAPLPPFGPSGEGWPLGRRVHGPELEAAALQVEGVEYLEALEVGSWDETTEAWVPGTVELDIDEVPHLTAITVVEPELDSTGAPVAEQPITLPLGEMVRPPVTGEVPVPIPIVREEC